MEPRAPSSLDKLQKKAMIIPAGIEAPDLQSSLEVKDPIQIRITAKDIFALPPERERGNAFVRIGNDAVPEDYEIKEDDLGPIGNILYARTKVSDPYAFQFLRDYYLLCKKQESNPLPQELKADLENFVRKYKLDSTYPLVNLTDHAAIRKSKLQPLHLDNFYDIFSQVFNAYFNDSNLSNIATNQEKIAVGQGRSKSFVQADLFKACLKQRVVDLQALKMEEKVSNPGKSSSREAAEIYLAQLDSQIEALSNFKERLKKITGHTSKTSLDRDSRERDSRETQHLSPDQRSSVAPSSPEHRISVTQSSPDRRSSVALSSPDLRQSMAPPLPPPLDLSLYPPMVNPDARVLKTGMSAFLGGHRHRSPVAADTARHSTVVQAPPSPTPLHTETDRSNTLAVESALSPSERRESRAKSPSKSGNAQEFMRDRSPSKLGAFARKRSASRSQRAETQTESKNASGPAILDTQADDMLACLTVTRKKLNEILTKSLYEKPVDPSAANAATIAENAAKALSDSVTSCMMDHITRYTDATTMVHELGEQSGLDPKTVGQLSDLASNVVGGSRGLMSLKGCSVLLQIVKGQVQTRIIPDDIFKRIPERVTAENPFGLSPVGLYMRELAAERSPKSADEKEDRTLPIFDFLYDLFQLQFEQMHGGKKIEQALEAIVTKYKLRESPNLVNVDDVYIKLALSVTPLQLSNFADAFRIQATETLNVTNYTSPQRSIDSINRDLLRLYSEQGSLGAFRSKLKETVVKQNPEKKAVVNEIEEYLDNLKCQLQEFQKVHQKYSNRSKHSTYSFHKNMSAELLQKIEGIIAYLSAESQRVENQFLMSLQKLSLVESQASSATPVIAELPGFSLDQYQTALSDRYTTLRAELEAFTSADDKKIIIKTLKPLMLQMAHVSAVLDVDQLDRDIINYNRNSNRGPSGTGTA